MEVEMNEYHPIRNSLLLCWHYFDELSVLLRFHVWKYEEEGSGYL